MDMMSEQGWREGRYLALNFAINARWFFLPVIFLVAVLHKLGPGLQGLQPELVILLVMIAINAIFRVRLSGLIREEASGRALWIFSAIQVAYDLVGVFTFILISGEVATLGMFFLAPVVVSMLTLGEREAWATALAAPIFLLSATLFTVPEFGSTLFGTTSVGDLFANKDVQKIFLGASLSSAFFLLIGGFSSRAARFFRERENDLLKKNTELSEAYDKLSELDELKSQMVSVAAHQLRTPLSGIKWMLKMLSGGDLGPLNNEQDKVAKDGFAAVEHLVELVNEMLEMDRIESGRVKFLYSTAEFNELMNEAIKEMSPEAQEKDITLCVGSDAPLIDVFVDKERIRGVIENLIDNAIKYSPRGATVDVFARSSGGAVELSVKDKGIGIPESEHKRIFSRFYRASNAVRAETEGTGLGLAIAQSVVMRHGGRMWFESSPENGSTFFFGLPYKSIP